MTTASQCQNAIQSVRDQASFLNRLLCETLGWPIEGKIEKIEDISYEWTKDELGALDLNAKIIEGGIWQMQPLSNDQQWGIFILEFKNPDVFLSGRGITGPLRKILRGLVPKRRRRSDLPAWSRENLLFICTHEYKHFRFAYFKAPCDGEKTAPLATFGWGPDIPNRTACEFNLPALEWPSDPASHEKWTKEWASAFSVEKVTKEFYEQYREVFENVEKLISRSTSLKNDELRLYTQTLFNRLMFLRFIERKNWLKFQNRTDYLAALHEAGGIGAKSLFKTRIHPLFFEGLAIEGKQSSAAIGEVPFLNGGLFEKSALDEKISDLPNEIFDPIIGKDGLFYRFNFTVEESTPLDIEVAVDPEMLGRVFEELVTGRHESGSYYTPRPIVSFMCREALKCVLADKTGASADSISALIDKHEISNLTDTHARAILETLDNLKAIDPACGSGAYLLGLLQEMVAIYRLLYSEKLVKDARSLYELKLRIISNNLYGVDLDPFATNIAMLRLWLSLAVEADSPVPLPNLDFKIECGDSLMGPEPHFGGLQTAALKPRSDALVLLKDSYMRSHGDEKDRFQKDIRKEETQISKELHGELGEGVIDWRIQFAEVFVKNDGFDIVLANPPYLRAEVVKQKFGDKYKAKLVDLYPYAYVKTADIYVAFYARANELLRPNGAACFISSNKWLRAGYGEKLKSVILDRQDFKMVVDFGELPVFPKAATFPAIFLWRKANRGDGSTCWAVVKDLDRCYVEGIRDHVLSIAEIVPAVNFRKGGSRLATSKTASIRQKMEKAGTRLKEYVKGQLFRGVLTGLNEAFVIDRQTRDRLISEDKHSTEIIKPLLVGNNIRHYEAHFREQYLIFAKHGIEIKNYPAVLKHLAVFRADLTPKKDSSEKRGRKPGLYKWYEIQDTIAYYEVFNKPKIIYPDIGMKSRFTIENNNYFVEATGFIIPAQMYYLVAILNSTSFFEYLKYTCSILGDEENRGRIRFKNLYMEPAPIPDAPEKDHEMISQIAKEVHSLHTERRVIVEKFLNKIGLPPADSTEKNPLEQPWAITEMEFLKRARKYSNPDPRLFKSVNSETAALTDKILKLENDIDARVSALYGL